MTPRELGPHLRARELELELEHDREALMTAFAVAHLGNFRRSVSPRELFEKIRFRPGAAPAGDPAMLAAERRKARERFRHLPGRGAADASAR